MILRFGTTDSEQALEAQTASGSFVRPPPLATPTVLNSDWIQYTPTFDYPVCRNAKANELIIIIADELCLCVGKRRMGGVVWGNQCKHNIIHRNTTHTPWKLSRFWCNQCWKAYWGIGTIVASCIHIHTDSTSTKSPFPTSISPFPLKATYTISNSRISSGAFSNHVHYTIPLARMDGIW